MSEPSSNRRASFWNGFHGGLIGGALSGIVIGVGYYFQDQDPRMIPAILVYALFIGAMTGTCSQLGIRWFRHHEIIGSALSTAVGGTLLGSIGGLSFGTLPRESINDTLLVVGALLGSMCVSAGIVWYDSGSRWYVAMRYCLLAFAVTVPCAILPFWFFEINDKAFGSWSNLSSGALIGTLVGFFMGAQIGLALVLYRRFFSIGALASKWVRGFK